MTTMTEAQDSHNAENDRDDNGKSKPEFVTTSYVLGSLNTVLQQVMSMPDETEAGAENAASGEKPSFFELQKRLPDGSTRKATKDEMSSADMKNKLEQSAALIANMTLEQKRQWAHVQRQYGNRLYRDGQYKEAIDIYLTCLVARGEKKTAKKDKEEDSKSSEEASLKNAEANTNNKDDPHEDDEWLLLPVMNNLAQCTLQLGWYQKTEYFCTMAMEHLGTNFYRGGPSVAKLYFKRGKARRLRGMFPQSKSDLNQALWHLKVAINDKDNTTIQDEEKSPEQKAIERELQLLAKNSKEGKKNEERQKVAMQKVLGSTSTSVSGEGQTTNPYPTDTSTKCSRAGNNTSATKANDHDISAPLYQDKQQRTHSTIRKRPEGPPPYPRISGPPLHLSYWQMYGLIMSRAAQRLLDIIGDGEEDNGAEDDGQHLKED